MKNTLSVFMLLTMTTIASWQDDFSRLNSKDKLLYIDKISWDRDGHRTFYAKDAQVKCYDLLHEFDHNLLIDDIERAHGEDIKKKYYSALRAVGLSFSEAREKVSSLIVEY